MTWLSYKLAELNQRQRYYRSTSCCISNLGFITVFCSVVLCVLANPPIVMADGLVIDKIYHPYVQPLEQEMEWRVTAQDNQPGVADHIQLHRFAYGRSLNESWFAEIYLVGEKSDQQNFDTKFIELEAKWQLTEQGEFPADWGLLFELEKDLHQDKWEIATGLLVEKEWRKWSGTVNFFVVQEWGADIADELEATFSAQARYRYSRLFEPAIELYSGQHTLGIGPVALGQIKFGAKRQVRWETGVIFSLDEQSPNQTVRFAVEFEF
ncbi:MAG: hypothetical protein P1U80_07610 [Pseudomonadales bacterium]|nr:hypothetical protein [Pseudomonadales bacterium]